MKRIVNELLAFSCLLLAASCADYNDLGGFSAEPDPSYTNEYGNLASVKSYINKNDYPNMSLQTSMALTTFNKQGLDHAVAVTNFDGVDFGYSFMPDKYVSKKGYMNFMALKEAIGHTADINLPVFGSPIVANEQQSDVWFESLTAPIEAKEPDFPHVTIEKSNGNYCFVKDAKTDNFRITSVVIPQKNFIADRIICKICLIN